ncbi:MAG: chemotaxis protein CheX [Thermodesulfobacteria bacterium]|nr:chemotaxis protein CheX [Thermodesulfobacteriota bacterium]
MSKSMVIDALNEAVKEVLMTFTGAAPTAEKSFVRGEPEALGEVSAVVGLTGKGFTGSFIVSFKRDCILGIVEALFGQKPGEINEEVKDAAGEMANMMCGAFRRRFEEQGISLQGSTPVVVTGEKHVLDILCKSQRLVIPYSVNGSKLFIEFCLDKS